MIADDLFAIVDIETTGFSPKRGDKIVEIAVVTTDIDGNQVDVYETLINPNRDMGATRIHKITSAMVKKAPTFEDVLDDLMGL